LAELPPTAASLLTSARRRDSMGGTGESDDRPRRRSAGSIRTRQD
jgi:hypothetical protein